MMCAETRERLQERMDGTLDPVMSRAVDRHLADCEPCRSFAADLAAVVDAAAALAPIDAPEHVWLQLAGRWRLENAAAVARHEAPAQPSVRSFAGWHALAAAAVLAVAIGGGWIAWRATGSTGGTDVILAKPAVAATTGNAAAVPLVESAQKDIEAAEQLYSRAIAGLEQAAESQKDLLEPQVAATLDKNIEVIDEAIGESRRAMRADPQSVVARESLFEAMRKKVTLLQNTISLVSEISRGNQAGASRLAGG
jgi:anti-sigma factor RsiW